MRLQEKFSFDDSGVSPVVGVILMVAITVILAAVIGTFVLDLGGQVQQNAQAGVMFDENEGTNVTVQLNSVQSADHIYVNADGGSGSVGFSGGVTGASSWTTGSPAKSTYDGGPSDGARYLVTETGDGSGNTVQVGGVGTTVDVDTTNADDDTVTVVGVLEGSETVIQTYDFTGGN